MNHKRLFIPGPVETRPENLLALATPQVGHRSKEFQELYADVNKKLMKFLHTEQYVFLSTSSSSGVMEGGMRNLVNKKVLATTCGAFSERWYKMGLENGKEADQLAVEWGKAVKPEMIDEKLKTGEYDSVAVVFNETSTGVMNPVKEIAEVVKKYPDVLLMVDAVSAMAGVDIDFDGWGLDLCLAGLQKCFGLPAGLAVFAVSEKALKRAEQVENRGFYFDFLSFKKYHDKNMTASTPAIPHIFALNAQMTDILAEGSARFDRHARMAKLVQDWANKHFEVFAEEGYASNTVTCIKNTRNISVADLNGELAKHQCTISNGYGDLKEKTFRIAHMADTQEWEIRGLLSLIDSILGH
ncbi:MAG: alanine--glyoxylate aminotransferase family protein [Acidobacteria bacterium]|nr:alanine--glyoxylate aminotransferase family protein [Acidobacteriota bacterium]